MRTKLWATILFLAFSAAPQMHACAVCFGLRDEHINNAVNMAIFVMFGCLILVLGSLAAFIITLARRAARHPLPVSESAGGFASVKPLNEV